PWLREVGVVERQPVRTSRDVTSGRSSRPRHRKVLYFPHRRLCTMEYSCKMEAHTQAALQAQLEAQTHYLLRRIGTVGDETLVEETLETDSERGD
ncbi:hypothetical protein Taro_006423, partial [Colocasia esculenta]|nr:hypothetical protein [Colocasia esculenta]